MTLRAPIFLSKKVPGRLPVAVASFSMLSLILTHRVVPRIMVPLVLLCEGEEVSILAQSRMVKSYLPEDVFTRLEWYCHTLNTSRSTLICATLVAQFDALDSVVRDLVSARTVPNNRQKEVG